MPVNILLAEDNPHDVTLVRLALHDAGVDCTLRVIADGGEALSFTETVDRDPRAPAIALMLLDLNLPRCDGEEILKRLRSTERIAQTPVVITTSSTAPDDYEMAQKHAAIHCFQKPSHVAGYLQLGVVVRDILANRKGIRIGSTGRSPRGGAA